MGVRERPQRTAGSLIRGSLWGRLATNGPSIPRPSPKCLHDSGRIRRTGGDWRGRREAREQLEFEPLAPEVARHHQVRIARSQGSNPSLTASLRRAGASRKRDVEAASAGQASSLLGGSIHTAQDRPWDLVVAVEFTNRASASKFELLENGVWARLCETSFHLARRSHPRSRRHGQRFLVPVTDQSAASQMTVVLNWLAGVQR
jgi:hypothetical protein